MAETRDEFLCDNIWDSWIGDVEDDGSFDLDVDDDGKITGWHILPDDTRLEVTGTCQHEPPHHFIEIWEDRNGTPYHYSGRIIPKSTGKHMTKGGKRSNHSKKPVADEVWTGVRTT